MVMWLYHMVWDSYCAIGGWGGEREREREVEGGEWVREGEEGEKFGISLWHIDKHGERERERSVEGEERGSEREEGRGREEERS